MNDEVNKLFIEAAKAAKAAAIAATIAAEVADAADAIANYVEAAKAKASYGVYETASALIEAADDYAGEADIIAANAAEAADAAKSDYLKSSAYTKRGMK
ncbi:MAG: hypothetical protein GY820_10360 [Gammaproteobacteria bacterium]|nr:hypothetical protein [Gammaproteobacteria bacterium]